MRVCQFLILVFSLVKHRLLSGTKILENFSLALFVV